jgi:hypothetical protein
MRTATWFFAAMVTTMPAWSGTAARGNGLTPDIDSLPWAHWQGRVTLAVQDPLMRSDPYGVDAGTNSISAVGLMSDYYFSRASLGFGLAGGFHATSGLILSPRAQAWGGQGLFGAQPGASSITRRAPVLAGDVAPDGQTIPYLGIGYTGVSGKGGWSLSADVGLVALSAGNAVRFGRVFGGSQSLDDVVRDMRLAPVMQVGVSYSF